MSTTPASQPPQSGPDAPPKKASFILWLLGLLGIGVAVLAVGGILVAMYVARNVQVQQSGDRVEVQTPIGSLKVDKSAETDPGLPVYPGAVVNEPGATVELGTETDEVLTVVAAKYRTSDPISKVDEWYQEKLGAEFKREGAGVMIRKKEIVGIQVNSGDIAFVAEDKDSMRVVVLERRGIHTEIGMARIGRPEAQ